MKQSRQAIRGAKRAAIAGIAVAAAAVAAVLIFTSRGHVAAGPGVLGADGVCRAALGSYCDAGGVALPLQARSKQCPQYADSLRQAKEEPLILESEAGTCGSLRFVSWSTGFVGESSYFNTDDDLVAVEAWSDGGGYCSASAHSIVYGSLPDCERKTTAQFKHR
jgi:hypothetical protein